MNPPMRMLVLLAVFWAAGSLLLAAESPSTAAPKPAPAAQSANPSDAAKDEKAGDEQDDKKAGDKAGDKGSIADQAEEALRVANEGDKAAAAKAAADKEAAKSAGGDTKDDTDAPPAGSVAKGPSPQRFMPSEQVRADFDVSFPIDI